jgi:hypothetical protein
MMLKYGIYLMEIRRQRKFLCPVWKFAKPVNGLDLKPKPVRNVDVL